jgi:hypothetical protein
VSEAQRQGRSLAVDVLLALSAVLISALSLAVAISANRTQEKLLAASTWPSLQFGTSNLSDDLTPEISFQLSNAGVGPARLRWVALRYKDQPIGDQSALFKACCDSPDGARYQSQSITSSIEPVLKAGETIKMFRLRKDGNPDWLIGKLNDERQHLTLRACYCSVLNDCWLFDSTSEQEPVSLAQCAALPVGEAWSG